MKHSYLSCDADVGASTKHSSSNKDWARSLVREAYFLHAFIAPWTSTYTNNCVKSSGPKKNYILNYTTTCIQFRDTYQIV